MYEYVHTMVYGFSCYLYLCLLFRILCGAMRKVHGLADPRPSDVLAGNSDAGFLRAPLAAASALFWGQGALSVRLLSFSRQLTQIGAPVVVFLARTCGEGRLGRRGGRSGRLCCDDAIGLFAIRTRAAAPASKSP